MTGSEIVVGAAAVGKVAQTVLGEDPTTKQQLGALVASSPALQVAADAKARRIAVKQDILLHLFQPLARLVGVSLEYFNTQFPKDLAEKTAQVPEESLITPAASVAIPSMEGLRYSLDEPDLKEMYLNLLAKASDARNKDKAHPSFAEVIKQLSVEEATVLQKILEHHSVPVAQIRVKNPENKGFTIGRNHVLDTVDVDGNRVAEPMVAVWVDNWIRFRSG